MSTHDELAYSVATDTVEQIRRGAAPWNSLFSIEARVTSSRVWPVPDFVISDETNRLSIAAEFKPPRQSKREYLTGLGQALAYTKDFHYGLLIVPTISDDNYRIADHILDVISTPDVANNPIGLISYDPASITPEASNSQISRFFPHRATDPAAPALLNESFYAKWREASGEEIGQFLEHLYDEGRRNTAVGGTIRDRAFSRLWADIQAGRMHHWGGGVRHAAITTREAVMKNYRNLLRRNPGRHAAAARGVARGFLKAEKQIWRILGLIVPSRARVYHPSRGFIFNWSRIAELLRD